MIRLVRLSWLTGFLFLILTGCNKDSDNSMHHNTTVVHLTVTDKLGNTIPNAEVKVYTAVLFHSFQSDVTVTPFLSVMTNNNGELIFKLEQEKWFVNSEVTELYFVVIQYLSPQNYHYWSAGGTIKTGENKKFVITTDYLENPEKQPDFEIKNGVLLKYTGTTDDTIILPDEIKEIAANCFAQSNIRQIVLNEGIEVIGDFAFYKSSIEKINFPTTLKVIGEHAFEDCTFLLEADLSKTILRTISASAFWGCGIMDLKFPECLEKIEAQAFLGTTRLKRIVLPYATTIIGNEAFRESGIESVQLSNNILSIGDRAFYTCEQLKQVTSEGIMGNNEGVVEIGCFENCSQLEQITLPQNIVELAGWTFIECHKLISLVVPPRIRTIGYHGLNGSAIKYITFQGKIPPQMNNSMPFYEKIKTIFVPQTALQDYKDKYPYYAEKIKAIA